MGFVAFLVLFFFGGFYLTYPLIMLFNGLAEAIAYLILIKPEKIEVFFGTYGNKQTQIKFKIGRFHCYIKQSLLLTYRGICKSSTPVDNYAKQIIIISTGLFSSLICACLMVSIAFSADLHGAVKLFSIALTGYSFLCLYSNLKQERTTDTGIGNRGQQLVFIIRHRKVYSKNDRAVKLYNNGEFKAAAEILKEIVKVYPEEIYLRPLVRALINLKNLTDSQKYLMQLDQCCKLNAQDYLDWGYAQSLTNQHELAINNYKKALAIEPENLAALNNLGYELALKGDYLEALEQLDNAIAIYPEFGNPYDIMGFVKIQTGDLEQGRQLIEKSLKLAPDNAYAYKHLGLYYLKCNNKQQAIKNFNTALLMDATVDVEPYMKATELL